MVSALGEDVHGRLKQAVTRGGFRRGSSGHGFGSAVLDRRVGLNKDYCPETGLSTPRHLVSHSPAQGSECGRHRRREPAEEGIRAADGQDVTRPMPEFVYRHRIVAGYAAEVRAFHIFFGASILLVASLHLTVVLPFARIRAAAPAIAASLAEARQQAADADEAHRAAVAASSGLAQFRRSLRNGPAELGRAIAALVARGRGAGTGDPYQATILVPGEAAAGGAARQESITVAEAIRRQIGRQTESLGRTLDATIEPLRALRNPPPEVADALRTAQEELGPLALAMNEILRAAFAENPGFWQRLSAPGASFGAASARASEAMRRIEEAVLDLDRRLEVAARASLAINPEARAREAAIRARQRELNAEAARFHARTDWLPLEPADVVRFFPILAGGLTITALFRLRRILRIRRRLGSADPDTAAPSWIVGPPSAPGRWWALLLVTLPLLLTIHGTIAAARDTGLYLTALGDPSPTKRLVFTAVYIALVLAATAQYPAVVRGLVGPGRRNAAEPARGRSVSAVVATRTSGRRG